MDRDARIEATIPALRRFAFSLLRDRHAADDLVQDSLERALGSWHLRRAEGDLKAWLFTILYNTHIDGRRREARRARLLGEIAGLAEQATPQDAPDHAVQFTEVLRHLDALPEEQRAILLLVGVEGLGYEETARVLGVPVGTVMSRLSRGRERLRRLTEEGGDTPAAGARLRVVG
ncbi:sigma-70 family RNA polymerase sigma factor [Roseicella aerolata]|uniref:Sigma-70 family RNA polymerase sigma factor n=1 Tax=Roseicella aerolata TaxID=2883479 RepID=A0A9X1IGH5_9PROT|nr:sigma-70 family RNA polymerase sigma factor [Roseicella aerolata]MCB4823741.1 sigma-70 family RNA polymerase sigma factor [Roseicella aerolata]